MGAALAEQATQAFKLITFVVRFRSLSPLSCIYSLFFFASSAISLHLLCNLHSFVIIFLYVYSGIPIFRTSKGNGNWFEKSGVRNIEGGIKSHLFYRGIVL